MRLPLLWVRSTTSLVRLLVLMPLLLRVADAGVQPHNTHLEGSPHTPSDFNLPTKSLKKEALSEDGAVEEVVPVVVVVEKLVMMERNVLERIKREARLEEDRPGFHDAPATLRVKETFVVHERQWGQLLLVVALGACIGLMGGVLLTMMGVCCYLKCSPGGSLDLDQKHSTYRSADVIDGVL